MAACQHIYTVVSSQRGCRDSIKLFIHTHLENYGSRLFALANRLHALVTPLGRLRTGQGVSTMWTVGVNPGGWGRDPQILGWGLVRGGRGGVVDGS